MGTVFGHSFQMYGSGNISNVYGFYMADAVTTGTIAMQVGLWIPQLSKGAANYSIYSSGTQPSYHGGLWQVGSPGIISAGPISGSNFNTDETSNTVKFGTDQSAATTFYGTYIGRGAGHAVTGNNNTFVGSNSGYSTVSGGANTYLGSQSGVSNTGSGNIFIGNNAGYWEVDSNLFLVSNTNTSSRPNYFMFGKMDAVTPANQYLTINGGLTLGTTTAAPTCDSTRRGQFWYAPGGAGVKDAVQVCAKDAANAYAWRTLY
jgi:hypothetical protein